MEQQTFPKLQFSKFIGQDQVVVRSDDKTEFLDLVTFIEDFIKKQPSTQQTVQKPTVSQQVSKSNTKECPIHPGVMMYLKDGKFGPYYSHGNKAEGYCNGKPKYEKTY